MRQAARVAACKGRSRPTADRLAQAASAAGFEIDGAEREPFVRAQPVLTQGVAAILTLRVAPQLQPRRSTGM